MSRKRGRVIGPEVTDHVCSSHVSVAKVEVNVDIATLITQIAQLGSTRASVRQGRESSKKRK